MAPSLFRGALYGIFLIAATSLGGCAYFDTAGARAALLERAEAQSWQPRQVAAPPFTLFTLSRMRDPAAVLTVYLEGDGRAWLDRTTPSADPTPERPVGLRLALADTAPNILYLARPCQYVEIAAQPGCEMRVWTSHRFAPDVVNAVSAAIDSAKRTAGNGSIELIGYSGGGAMAALVAARRKDVIRVITVAANLDLAAWTDGLKVDRMIGSLDPAQEADRIAHIAQFHLVGRDDDIVPPGIVRNYQARSVPPAGIPRVVEEVPGYGHDCCWHLAWEDRIAKIRRRLQSGGNTSSLSGPLARKSPDTTR